MITVNIYYSGENGSARAFAEEMVRSGVVADIRAEEGNLRYAYFSRWTIPRPCCSSISGGIRRPSTRTTPPP